MPVCDLMIETINIDGCFSVCTLGHRDTVIGSLSFSHEISALGRVVFTVSGGTAGLKHYLKKYFQYLLETCVSYWN